MLYIAGGYFLPFIVYSMMMLVLAPFAVWMIPSKPKEDSPQPKDQSESDSELWEDIDQSSTTV